MVVQQFPTRRLFVNKRTHKIIRTGGQKIALMNTSRIPDKEIVEAIKFVAKEIDLNKVVIHFKKDSDRARRAGRAYYAIPEIANMNGLKRWEWRYLIIVADGFKSTVTHSVMDTLGHEAKHIEQHRRGILRREKRNRNCEAQCNAFGGWIADIWEEHRDRMRV